MPAAPPATVEDMRTSAAIARRYGNLRYRPATPMEVVISYTTSMGVAWPAWADYGCQSLEE